MLIKSCLYFFLVFILIGCSNNQTEVVIQDSENVGLEGVVKDVINPSDTNF